MLNKLLSSYRNKFGFCARFRTLPFFVCLLILGQAVFFSCRASSVDDDLYIGDYLSTLPPRAEGGEVIITEMDGEIYEVHIFRAIYETVGSSGSATDYELVFAETPDIQNAGAIIVAGGGGGGGTVANDSGGGGGGGGVIYKTDLEITGNVIVSAGSWGTGGGGATNGNSGWDGADSSFGNLIAKGGGGGGAGRGNTTQVQGKTGGSSGGGGSGENGNGSASTSANPWSAQSDGESGPQGYKGGGGAFVNSHLDCGGGGGGAGGKGQPGTGGTGGLPGAGGLPIVIENIPHFGSLDLSPGGAGGTVKETTISASDQAVQNSELFGAGGAGGTGSRNSTSVTSSTGRGASGNKGIVIVWWKYY